MLDAPRVAISAKIAAGLTDALAARARSGAAGGTTSRVLGRDANNAWSVLDVICTSGPADRSYEERHTGVSIAIVASGSFEYRTTVGRALMTPGSMLLGAEGRCFECGHTHAEGDRCISFRYSSEYFERLAADAGAKESAARGFAVPRLPALREFSAIVVEATRGLLGRDVAWDELAVRLGAAAARSSQKKSAAVTAAPAGAERRVTAVIREIERSSAGDLPLPRLAGMAGLSPFHFLRTFQRLTGLTPHQYVRRLRLREAALRLAEADGKVIDAAYESGFTDLSAFNKGFRAEFDVSPRLFRRSRAKATGAFAG
jgi:AraC-like DNA-binding protein